MISLPFNVIFFSSYVGLQVHNIFILFVVVTKKTRCGKKKKEEKDTVDAKNVNFKYLTI